MLDNQCDCPEVHDRARAIALNFDKSLSERLQIKKNISDRSSGYWQMDQCLLTHTVG